jgi:UDP-glucuronate decarboxylase
MHVADLVESFLRLTGSRAGVVHAPLPKDDPVRRNPNIARAQELLGGWAPNVPLEQGLKATVEYFRGRQESLERGL